MILMFVSEHFSTICTKIELSTLWGLQVSKDRAKKTVERENQYVGFCQIFSNFSLYC